MIIVDDTHSTKMVDLSSSGHGTVGSPPSDRLLDLPRPQGPLRRGQAHLCELYPPEPALRLQESCLRACSAQIQPPRSYPAP